MEPETKLWTVMITFMLLIMGVGITSIIDLSINDSLCDKYGPGYYYVFRPYFIGEKKCFFSQETYDRDVKTIYLNDTRGVD
jgi:hypothetical protein